MFDYDQLYHRHALPRVNPLIRETPGETSKTVASVLSVLRAVDTDAMDDLGGDGIAAILETAAAALEAGAKLEETAGFWVGEAPAARLRAIAERDECSVAKALERALAWLESTPHHITDDPQCIEDTRRRHERVRDLAQAWVDALDQAPAPSEG